jgi:hypothetical protein
MLPPVALDAARRVAEQAPPLSARQAARLHALFVPVVEQPRGPQQGAA